MSAQNFDRVMDALVFPNEGGYVNHPADPGGPTNFGITQATLSAHRGHPVTAAEVRAMPKTEAREIYRASYAAPVWFDKLPPGVDASVLDFAVNAGPARAVRTLQSVVGAAQDGLMGPKTLLAVEGRDPAELVRVYNAARLAFHRRLSTWSTFGPGWTRRINATTSFSVALARGRSATPVYSAAAPDDQAAAKARSTDTAVTSTKTGKSNILTTAGAVTVGLTQAVNQAKDSLIEHVASHEWIAYAVAGLTLVGGVGIAAGIVLNFKATADRIASGTPV